jgi:hypothetical protein
MPGRDSSCWQTASRAWVVALPGCMPSRRAAASSCGR